MECVQNKPQNGTRVTELRHNNSHLLLWEKQSENQEHKCNGELKHEWNDPTWRGNFTDSDISYWNLEYDMKRAVCRINLKALLWLLEGFLKSCINCIASYRTKRQSETSFTLKRLTCSFILWNDGSKSVEQTDEGLK